MYSKYQGKYSIKNPQKYAGDPYQVFYRSLWELAVMRWLDLNDSVKSWSSEEVVIPYRCPTDNKLHRYFMDFKITFSNGDVYLIEVKPKCQMSPPKRGKKSEKFFLKEVLTYGKNQSKWKQAKKYAEDRNYKFQIWNEDALEKLGIRVIGSNGR